MEKGFPPLAQEPSCRRQAGPFVPAEDPRGLLPLLASFPDCSAGPERVPQTDMNVRYTLLEALHLHLLFSPDIWSEPGCGLGGPPESWPQTCSALLCQVAGAAKSLVAEKRQPHARAPVSPDTRRHLARNVHSRARSQVTGGRL